MSAGLVPRVTPVLGEIVTTVKCCGDFLAQNDWNNQQKQKGQSWTIARQDQPFYGVSHILSTEERGTQLTQQSLFSQWEATLAELTVPLIVSPAAEPWC